MTNINCSKDCIYEKNGKCNLNYINSFVNTFNTETECGYFVPKKQDLKLSSKNDEKF